MISEILNRFDSRELRISQGGLESAALPKFRSFETVQIAYYGSKHINLEEVPATLTIGSYKRPCKL